MPLPAPPVAPAALATGSRRPRRSLPGLWLACAWVGMAAPAVAEGDLRLAAEHYPMAMPRAASVQPVPGLKIDYNLLADADADPAEGRGRLRGALAVPHGRVVASVLVDPGATEGRRLARLDTRWQSDLPHPLQTVVVGDTVGSGGGWSRPVRFGGVRLGRAPMLRPGYVDAPQAAAPESAALPAAVPWHLTGRHDRALAAARDLLGPAPPAGPATVGTPAPLAAGASDYEFEAGRLRSGWGTADDRYGDPYAAAAYRQGLGLEVTAEGRAEWTPDRVATGVELSRSFGDTAAVRAVLARASAASRTTPDPLQGLRRGMAVEGRIAQARWKLVWDGYDRGFTPLAAGPAEPDTRSSIAAGTSLPLWGRASASVSYARQTRWTGSPEAVLGLQASVPLTDHARVDLSYSLRQGPQPAWEAGLKLSVPLDPAPGS